MFFFSCCCGGGLEIRALGDKYVRSVKLTSNGKTLVVGGETNAAYVWDLEGVSLARTTTTTTIFFCYKTRS